jgi:hypothetical protein
MTLPLTFSKIFRLTFDDNSIRQDAQPRIKTSEPELLTVLPNCLWMGKKKTAASAERHSVNSTRAHFIRKLYMLMGDKSNKGIVEWSESLDSVVIFNPDQFVSKVLPIYFKHSKIESFERQMNFYG